MEQVLPHDLLRLRWVRGGVCRVSGRHLHQDLRGQEDRVVRGRECGRLARQLPLDCDLYGDLFLPRGIADQLREPPYDHRFN